MGPISPPVTRTSPFQTLKGSLLKKHFVNPLSYGLILNFQQVIIGFGKVGFLVTGEQGTAPSLALLSNLSFQHVTPFIVFSHNPMNHHSVIFDNIVDFIGKFIPSASSSHLCNLWIKKG
jgi:hypothetical protein